MLRWVFTLYDADGDGTISREGLRDVVSAVHRLTSHGNIAGRTLFTEVGTAVNTASKAATSATTSQNDKRNNEMIAERHADRIFQKLDLNCDGQVTWDEFLETCTKDENISNTMALLDVAM